MYNKEKGDEIALLFLAVNADVCEFWNRDMWAQIVFPSFTHLSPQKLEIHLCLCLDSFILHFLSRVLAFFWGCYFMSQTQHHSVSTDSDTVTLLQVRIITKAPLNDKVFQSVAPFVCLTLSFPGIGNGLRTLELTTSPY